MGIAACVLSGLESPYVQGNPGFLHMQVLSRSLVRSAGRDSMHALRDNARGSCRHARQRGLAAVSAHVRAVISRCDVVASQYTADGEDEARDETYRLRTALPDRVPP
jgi:hypothetical protein